MKKTTLLFILFFFVSNVNIANIHETNSQEENVYTYNIEQEANSSTVIPKFFPLNIFATKKFPTFWVVLIISAIGAFTLYGLAAGLIAVTIVYFVTKGNKTETKKAFWGFLIGLVVGLGIKLLTFLLI